MGFKEGFLFLVSVECLNANEKGSKKMTSAGNEVGGWAEMPSRWEGGEPGTGGVYLGQSGVSSVWTGRRGAGRWPEAWPVKVRRVPSSLRLG